MASIDRTASLGSAGARFGPLVPDHPRCQAVVPSHLKDVDSRIAAKVQSGLLTYSEAVGQGMYRPLRTGDVDVPAIVGHVLAQGYDGWYTLEQDTILTEEPTHHGPVKDVAAGAEYLRTVLRGTG